MPKLYAMNMLMLIEADNVKEATLNILDELPLELLMKVEGMRVDAVNDAEILPAREVD